MRDRDAVLKRILKEALAIQAFCEDPKDEAKDETAWDAMENIAVESLVAMFQRFDDPGEYVGQIARVIYRASLQI